MDIEKAVLAVAEKIHQTKWTTASAVHQMFGYLNLSDQSVSILAAEGLASRVNSLLTSGRFQSANPTLPEVIIKTQFEPTAQDRAAGRTQPTRVHPPPIKIAVDVTILYDTRFEVFGVRKPIIEFTGRDLGYMLDLYGAEIAGYSARAEVFSYAKDRLKTLHKTRISDLAVGEQTILARKWKDATKTAEKVAVA